MAVGKSAEAPTPAAGGAPKTWLEVSKQDRADAERRAAKATTLRTRLADAEKELATLPWNAEGKTRRGELTKTRGDLTEKLTALTTFDQARTDVILARKEVQTLDEQIARHDQVFGTSKISTLVEGIAELTAKPAGRARDAELATYKLELQKQTAVDPGIVSLLEARKGAIERVKGLDEKFAQTRATVADALKS
jgi:hypothetical protein